MKKLTALISPPTSNNWKDSIPYWLVLIILTVLPVFVVIGLEDTGINRIYGGIGMFIFLSILWIVIALFVSSFFQKLHTRRKQNSTIKTNKLPAEEPISNELKNEEIKTDIHNFLDTLCSESDMAWFTNQIIAISNDKTPDFAKTIKLNFPNKPTEQDVKDEVSYYAYKMFLILKRKKIKQRTVSSYFHQVFSENFPKISEDTFSAKLKDCYNKHSKRLNKKFH